MKGIPPEIDSLLWAVAEDESPRAGDEFVTRYPKYAGELARRRRMVQGLKGGRPMPPGPNRGRPAFRPASPVKTQPVPRRTLVGVGALLLAAIAVASYTIATVATPSSPKTPPPVQVVQTEPVTPKDPEVQYVPPAVQTPPDQGHSGGAGPFKDEELEPPLLQGGPKGQNFKVKGADLAGALAMLGAEAGVKIIVAPGMGKRIIDADYENVPVNQILRDMGQKFGFTAFDQGDGSIIVVPATEEEAPDSLDDRRKPFAQGRNEPKAP